MMFAHCFMQSKNLAQVSLSKACRSSEVNMQDDGVIEKTLPRFQSFSSCKSSIQFVSLVCLRHSTELTTFFDLGKGNAG